MADDANLNQNDDGAVGDVQPVTSVSLADLKTAGIPETYFGQDGNLNTADLIAHLSEHANAKTAAEARAGLVPADGNYDFGLPKDWKAPEGVTVSKETMDSWSVSDGRKAVFAEYAKTNNLSQTEVSDIMGKLAAADISEKVAEAAKIEKAFAEDEAKNMAVLGANAEERNTNLKAAINARMGAGMAENIKFLDAATFVAFEKFINGLGGSHANHVGGNTQQQAAEFVPGQGAKYLAQANSKSSN